MKNKIVYKKTVVEMNGFLLIRYVNFGFLLLFRLNSFRL